MKFKFPFFRKNKPSVPAGFSIPYRKTRLSSNEHKKFIDNSKASMQITPDMLVDKSRFSRAFFAFCARHIPSVSNAVWIWQNLCFKNLTISFHGSSAERRNKAMRIFESLNARISPMPFTHSPGIQSLALQFFRSLFIDGRFAGNIILDPNHNSISDFLIQDPFSIIFTKGNKPIPYLLIGSDKFPLNQNLFIFNALNSTFSNPYGFAMLESAQSLLSISNDMIQNMFLASGNAALPRLHIKISQPEKGEFEDEDDYRKRVATYFSDTVSQFGDIAPDDNIYSWSDVEVSTVGGDSVSGFVWAQNRSVVDEEIISSFHLYPWLMGKSYSTTKNWVRSQFDILLSQVHTIQSFASSFLDWVIRMELNLNGIHDVLPVSTFSTILDPGYKDRMIGDNFHMKTVFAKIDKGIISPDDGARELGYQQAYDPEKAATVKISNPDSNSIHLSNLADTCSEILDIVSDGGNNNGTR